MNTPLLRASVAIMMLACSEPAFAHLLGDPAHDGGPATYDFSVAPPTRIVLSPGAVVLVAQANPRPAAVSAGKPSTLAATFQTFAPKVRTRTDERFLYVESDGIPAHNMMVGITAWQQQVPLPQPYVGDNAWRIPLVPAPSKTPVSIKNRFLRGAIALAANGIPIFNPQNNRGEVSQEIGELDQWGGHCGRADDYHYHAAPLHLQAVLGKQLPIAYALDGYPIYGLTEPDGAAPQNLDAFNGHETPALGYHYHGSNKYPYVNGGFHGEVVEREGQVDPQPHAQPVREALQALRGAKITGFTAKGEKSYSLQYQVGSEMRQVNYALNSDKSVKFEFVDGSGQVRSETYSPRQRGPVSGNGERPPGESKGGEAQKKGDGKGKRGSGPGGPRPDDRADARPGEPRGREKSATPPMILKAPHSGKLTLQSSVVKEGGALPVEFTGDGTGFSPPVDWKGAPAGTKSFAVVMDHLAPGNEMKCYWTVWDIPGNVSSLPKDSWEVGKMGPAFKGAVGYEPPHSQGPGLKTYTIHVYALSAPPKLDREPRQVTREVLLTAIKDLILDSAELNVTYTKPGGETSPRRPDGKDKKGPNP